MPFKCLNYPLPQPPSGQTSADPRLPHHVDAEAAPESDGARFTLSLVFGEADNRTTMQVASRHLDVDEEVRMTEMAEYGVPEVKVTLVRLSPAEPAQPSFSSNAPSIELVTIRHKDDPRPRPFFGVTIKNVSSKPIIAIAVTGNYWIGAAPYEGPEGKPLIEPNGTYEFVMAGDDFHAHRTKEGFVPEGLQGVKVLSIVFRDGSYEGDSGLAFLSLARRAGERVMLRRVEERLDQAVGFKETDLAKIRAEILALSEDVGEDEVNAWLTAFPSLATLRPPTPNYYGVGFWDIKVMFSAEVQTFEFSHAKNAATENEKKDWVKLTRDKFAQWLSRLEQEPLGKAK